MATSLTDRNRAVVAYRQAGHTVQQTATAFNIKPYLVREITATADRVLQAAEKLRADPGDLRAMALCGNLRPQLQIALEHEGVRHVDDLRHLTLRQLGLIANVGPKAQQQIIELAREWGIEFPKT
jgi:hypothetical protein